MMHSEIRTFSYPNGEIQRVQVVRLECWEALEFLRPVPSEEALDCFSHIYRKFLVPACPWLFGHLVMFRLPEDLEVPFSFESKKYGSLDHRLTAAAAALEAGMFIRRGKPVFRDDRVKAFWQALEARDCIRIVSGKLPVTTMIPLGNQAGYLTATQADAAMKVNASFFIMDRFDCATVYDHVGTPLGLCVKDGTVTNPPLFGREALLVRRNGVVSVEPMDVRDLTLEINGTGYRHGRNATVFTRPERSRTPGCGDTKLVIIGCRVAAVYHGRSAAIPASGFVLCVPGDCQIAPGDRVTYRGLEDVVFGIQVGNSILRDGVKTKTFRSRFYNIRKLEPIPFPPSLYPMDFDHARAARIALGADRDGKPMLLWAEGAGKLRYTAGQDSCGASLSEMADICEAVGMMNAVNLDGGGSAQLLLNNQRSLHISDRKEDNTDAERLVPLGLMVR